MSRADPSSLPDDSLNDHLLEVLVQSADAASRGEPVDPCLLAELSPAERGLLDTACEGLKLLSQGSSDLSWDGQSASISMNPLTAPLRIGRYLIERPLGSGGFAIVYLARDPFTGRLAAVKIPRPHAQLTSHLRDKFVREAQASAQLDHPNVVPIYEAGVDDSLPYIASAYCDGPPLNEWVKDSADPVPTRLAARLIHDLAQGVQYSHDRGILHRDITPSNVLLFPQTIRQPDSSPFIPKLSDFGLAKMIEECDTETTMSLAMGTPAYVAPEQAANDRGSISPAVDVYGLGAVLYFALTGRAPFVADTPWETLTLVRQAEPVPPHMFRPNVPRELDLICLKCLSKDPAQRYSTAQELADDLTRWLEGRPILARPVSWTRKAWQWCRRNPSLAALGGVLTGSLFLMLAGLSIYTAHVRSLSDEVIETNVRLRESVEQLDAAVIDRTRSQQLAEERARALSEAVYSMEVSSAAEAWRRNDAIAMRDALSPYLQIDPQIGDLREFSWHYLWQQQTVQEIFRKILPVEQYSVAFSPDGTLVAVAGADSVARFFKVSDGATVRELDTKQREVNSIIFSKQGDWFATAGDDGSVCLWTYPDCKLRYRSTVFTNQQAFQVAHLRSQDEFIVCGNSPELKFLDSKTGRQKAQLTDEHNRTIENLAISPDETKVITCGLNGTPLVWQMKDKRPLIFDSLGSALSCAAWTEDSRFALVGSTNGLLRVLDTMGQTVVAEQQFPDGLQSICHLSGQTFLLGDRTGAVTALKFEDLPEPGQKKIVVENRWALHQHRVYGLATDARNDLFATASRDHQIGVFRPSHLRPLLRRNFFSSSPRLGKFHVAGPDSQGRTYRISPEGLAIFRRDAETPEQNIPLEYQLFNLKLTGNKLLAGAYGGLLLTLDVSDELKEPSIQRPLNGGSIGAFVLLNNDRLLIPDDGSTVTLWNHQTHKIEKTFSNHHSVAVSEDGTKFVLARNLGHRLELYNAKTLQLEWSSPGHTGTIPALLFGKSGKYLYSGGTDRSIRIWDVATGQEIRQFRGNGRAINTMAISSDERTIAAGEVDGGLRLWDARTGRSLFEIANLDDTVLNLEFTPDDLELIAYDTRLIEYHWSVRPDRTSLQQPVSAP